MSDASYLPPDPVPPSYAPPVMPPGPPPATREECTLAMLAHVLQIFSWIIGPAIILLVRRDSKFVRYHAWQVLLFQALVIVVCIASVMTLILGAVVAGVAGVHRGDPGAAMLAFPVLFMLLIWIGSALTWFLNLVLAIVYGLRANNGEWSGYPGLKYLAARIAGVELP